MWICPYDHRKCERPRCDACPRTVWWDRASAVFAGLVVSGALLVLFWGVY